jgi:uncharacterized protein YndB with AHSA1/START domain
VAVTIKRIADFDQTQSVTIAAKRAKVWKALTADIGRWWPRTFCSPNAKKFTLEAKIGGRFFEDHGPKGGLMWGSVITLETNASLTIAADFTPAFGGPGRVYTAFTLEDDGAGTKLSVRETGSGSLDSNTPGSLADGWRMLLEGQLKPYCEGKKPLERAFRAAK